MSEPEIVEMVVPAGAVVVIITSKTSEVPEEESRQWERPAPDSDPMYGGSGGGHQ